MHVMRRGLLSPVFVTLPLALAGAAIGASAWPEVPDPPRAKVEWVARDVRVNGLPSQIERFESELSVDEVLEFYRARWSRSRIGSPQENKVGPWQSVSTLQGSYQLAVQVRPRTPQGSEGLISVANFGDMKRDFVPADWPRWRDLKVTQVTESVDGPRRSQMVAMVSDASFDMNQRRWREEWERRGFRLTHEQLAPGSAGTRSWLASFDRPPLSLDVTMAWRDSDRRTFISANLLSPVEGAAR
jgi:hypothetical protein